MHQRLSHQTLPGVCSLAILSLGMLIPMGCTQQSAGRIAFRRFWGFDRPGANQIAGQSKNHPGGLMPMLLGQQSSEPDWTEDPFLKQNFSQPAAGQVAIAGRSAARDVNANSKAGEEQPNAVAVYETALAEQQTLEKGNPFRLVEHESPVSEVSSAGDRNGDEAIAGSLPGTSSAKANGPSQLDRLKIALHQDTKTHLTPKPPQDSAELARQRVEAMMKNARRQIQLGEYVSALRWATAAEQLAGRSELFFRPEEDPPADLVRSLEDRLKVAANSPQASTAQAMADQAVPLPAAEDFPQYPAKNAEPSALQVAEASPLVPVPEPPLSPSSFQHSTRAMQKAVIAPETLTPPEQRQTPATEPPLVADNQMPARSLKVDAQRVNANQGAVVSVEGQLNAPREAPLPQELPLAPPVMEDYPKLPPYEVAMTAPAPVLAETPPPLPPPSAMVQAPPSVPPEFLYAENAAPPTKPVKNVQWSESKEEESSLGWGWWAFPVLGVLGMLGIGLLFLRRRRA